LILRIDRYISSTVFKAMLVVLIAFVGLNIVFQLVDELREKYVGYGFWQAVVYVLLTLPRRIYELIPYVAFLGTLVGLGQLAGQNELTVLRAAGVSWPARIAIGYTIGAWLASGNVATTRTADSDTASER